MALTYSALDDLTAQIIQEAPGCPPNQVTLHLSRAVREFLIRTQAWKATFSVTVEILSTTYSIPTEEDIYIDTINSAEIDKVSYLDDVELSNELEFTVSSEFATEHDGENLIIKAVVVPYTLPCIIPSRIVNRYAEFLRAGALSYIYGTTGRPYSNEQKSIKEGIKFQKGLRRGISDTESENKRISVNWSC